jgi:hypothetical protein
MSFQEIVLTRYLYSKTEVAQSLMMSLIDRQTDESLFWAYELYYSGFEEYAFHFLYHLYKSLYEEKNPKLRDFIYKTPLDECHLGSIVFTLAYREYDLSPFISQYFSRKSEKIDVSHVKKNQLRIVLTPSDISKYQTQTDSSPRKVLSKVCRFPIRHQVLQLFQTDVPEDRIGIYHGSEKWLEYAAKSPVWEKRIREHGGIVNEDGHLFFPTDDEKESFYELWGYEPEEQTKEIQEQYMGNNATKSFSIEEFATQYGYQLEPSKKRTIKKKLSNNLENTLLPIQEPIKPYIP